MIPFQIKSVTALTFVAVIASGCVSFPDFGSETTPEAFQQEIAGLDGYPSAATAPVAPVDGRSAAQWDRDASEILALKAEFERLEASPVSTRAQIEAARARLVARLNAYKLDDPQ